MTEIRDHADPARKAEEDTKAEARSAEAAAIRRRWLTLGEALAVIAVVISALTLWNNWSERADNDAASREQGQRASVQARTLVLTAVLNGDRGLTLKPVSADQSVQAQAIMFPTALGVAPVQTTGEPRIEADWFADALKKARNDAGKPDTSRGDERLPVVITTDFMLDGKVHHDVAIYEIGYTVSGRWIAGHTMKLRGVSLVSHVEAAAAQAKVNARWGRVVSGK